MALRGSRTQSRFNMENTYTYGKAKNYDRD